METSHELGNFIEAKVWRVTPFIRGQELMYGELLRSYGGNDSRIKSYCVHTLSATRVLRVAPLIRSQQLAY